MRGKASAYEDLRVYCETLPVIDCHDHTGEVGPAYQDPLQVILSGYFQSDMTSASTDRDVSIIKDSTLSLEERWPLFEKIWKRTCHTGYARVTRLVLEHFYNINTISLENIKSMESRLLDLTNAKIFEEILKEAGIVLRILDIWPDKKKVMDKSLKLSPRGRLAISLPEFHRIRSYDDVQEIGGVLNRNITSLDEYLDVCRTIFEGHKSYGAVTFKDQSAYTRSLNYGNPGRREAESVFNKFMIDPRRSAAYPEGIKDLDDYLFNEFMRMARDLDLPVQIHTGHMAGIRNNIEKTNAAGLRGILELHRDVRFDLFHGNWPYGGDYLFLAKNYPNVALNFCWANIIDPIYCQNMYKQIISSVPHGKIHAYGSDFVGSADRAWAHVKIARDNVSLALSDMVEIDYLSLDEAKETAKSWFYDNPNHFFRLGLPDL